MTNLPWTRTKQISHCQDALYIDSSDVHYKQPRMYRVGSLVPQLSPSSSFYKHDIYLTKICKRQMKRGTVLG